MINIGLINGSKAQAKPYIIGKTTVYLHTGIKPLIDEYGNYVEGLFSYYETQYDKDEYIQIIAEKNASLEQEFTNMQIALTEIYESVIV